MKLKSLLICAAGLFAVTGAQAADLPPAPEPVDYVRVCDAFGSGFFYIPGTDSCLRLRGRLRTEVRYRNQAEGQPVGLQARGGVRGASPFFMRARGYWGWDHRTNTDIGLVRAFFRGFLTKNSGNGTATAVNLDYAFIQIGGLTLGFSDMVIEPVFGGYVLEHSFSTGGYEEETVIAQYVYSFGNGFSVGAVILDETSGSFGTNLQVVGVVNAGVPFVPVAYGGNRIPAAGASITYDGSIGTFRLAGLIRGIRPAAATSPDHDFGWAVGFSGEIGVPIGTNTSIGFNAQYADGAIAFLHYDSNFLPVGDFTVNAATGNISTSKGWSVTGGLTTQVAAKTTFNLTAGYTDINQSNGVVDVSWWDVQANLQYRLTSNLVLTAEGQWRNVNVTGLRDSDAFSTILRAQLDF